MLFSSQLPLTSLIELCRSMKHNLGAGLTLVDVFRQQSRRGPGPVRPVAERIYEDLKEGDSLEDALEREKAAFPPLFLSMAGVGEQTGTLPEVFTELERYFVLQHRLRQQFLVLSFWPVLQLIAAIFVIAGMIFLLAILTPSGNAPFDPLGLGLTGVGGAVSFLVSAFGSLVLLVAGYFLVTRLLQQKALVDAMLLHLPGFGPCLTAVAMARFCLAMRLTLDTSLSIATALRLSLRATGNAAFAAQTDTIKEALRGGDDVATALSRCGLFDEMFVNIVANGEEGGRLPEVMKHQAEQYQEEAERRLTMAMRMAAMAIWLVVAGLLVFMIFRIAMSVLGVYDSIING
jgi:type IV pilus assembly protein PilC